LKSSDTATYALRRLKRDHPELAEKVVSGKLSAHAAAIGGRHLTSLFTTDDAGCMLLAS
jgi:hypothetical protein